MEKLEHKKENLKEQILNKLQELRKTLPEQQSNTRTSATQNILDFAAMIYQVDPYNEGLESGKYISWLQDLDADAYNASLKLNGPQKES